VRAGRINSQQARPARDRAFWPPLCSRSPAKTSPGTSLAPAHCPVTTRPMPRWASSSRRPWSFPAGRARSASGTSTPSRTTWSCWARSRPNAIASRGHRLRFISGKSPAIRPRTSASRCDLAGRAAATFGVTCPIRGFRPGHPRRSELLPGVGSSFVPNTGWGGCPGSRRPPAPEHAAGLLPGSSCGKRPQACIRMARSCPE
jgi:hypothetical protein